LAEKRFGLEMDAYWFTARYRYRVPLSPTVFLGDPPDDLLKTADGVVTAFRRPWTL
jgi:hypothetical protein